MQRSIEFIQLVAEKKRLVELQFKCQSLDFIKGQGSRWASVLIAPLASVSTTAMPLLVLYSSSFHVPQSVRNDAHLFLPSHPRSSSLIYSLCCVSPCSAPLNHPLSSSHSWDDFKWLQGKLFGVQVEFRRRPGTLSLFSLNLSKPTRESIPQLPLDMGSAWKLKAPRMAIVIQSPVVRTLCLIK